MNKEDFGAVRNLYESIITEAPLRDEPLWDGPGDKPKRNPTANAPLRDEPLWDGPGDKPKGGLTPAPTRPATPATSPARPTATTPATTPARPATPARPSGPSSSATATTAQKIKGGMDVYKSQVKSGDVKGAEATGKATWAAANPTLANKPKTPNPLLKDNQLSSMRSASVMRQNNMSLPGAKNPTSSDISMSQQKAKADSIVKSGAVAALAPKPAAPTPTTAATPSPAAVTKPVAPSRPAMGSRKPGSIVSSYSWGNKTTLKDIAGAYQSVYEAKKKDQDKDGDNDFADVRIARMIASGVPKAQAIAAVKNKEYNEEYELDEATRMRKELGKEGETRVRGELAARSKAFKRSGSVDKTIAAAERGADRPYIKHKRDESDSDRRKREEKQSRTLRGLAAARRGSVRDKPRTGMSGYAAKVEGSDKELQTSRQKAMSAGTLTPKERKQMGEEYTVYEIVASYLLENNFAETLNDANVIIENMSENWVAQILESFE